MLPHTNPKVSELTEGQREYVLPDYQTHLNATEGVMPLGLRRFGEALLEKVPSLKVTQRAARTKLWVYHPDETYLRGWIGYGDFRQDPETREDTYWIFSRNIQNNRYNWGDGQFMRNSKKLDKALQIAAMALSPWDLSEIGQMTWNDMSSSRSKENDRLLDESQKIISPYLDSTYSHRMEGFKTLLDELENLVAEVNRGSPYKWLNDSFGGDLHKYFELRRKNNSILNRTDYAMVLAWVERNALQTVMVDSHNSWGYKEGYGHKTYPLDEIPEDLMGKMSVLHNVDKNTYIPDVGVRVAEEVYYVYQS
jgi:hypothetical protein|tara:strand:+ start:1500 stop:2423 length:924 start_codon:yes stop_codon:yes gene_type:complete